jgi:hypothetical protein
LLVLIDGRLSLRERTLHGTRFRGAKGDQCVKARNSSRLPLTVADPSSLPQRLQLDRKIAKQLQSGWFGRILRESQVFIPDASEASRWQIVFPDAGSMAGSVSPQSR